MSTWNYRVVKTKEGQYVIMEVYYSQEGKPDAMSSAEAAGDTLQELKADYISQLEAFKAPVLDEETDFPKEGESELAKGIKEAIEHPEKLIPMEDVFRKAKGE